MAPRNLENYRAGHQAFNQRDFEAMTRHYADSIAWTDHAQGRQEDPPGPQWMVWGREEPALAASSSASISRMTLGWRGRAWCPGRRSATTGCPARSGSGAPAAGRDPRAPDGTGRWSRRSSRSGGARCRPWAARSSRPPGRRSPRTGRSRAPPWHPSAVRPGRTPPRRPAARAGPRSPHPANGRTWDQASETSVFSCDPGPCRIFCRPSSA